MIYQELIIFQPAHPVGGATRRSASRSCQRTFQPAHLVGGATDHLCGGHRGNRISTRAPRGRCDPPPRISCAGAWYFNPRTSWEVRLIGSIRTAHPGQISTRAPRGRCDRKAGTAPTRCSNFNPRTSWEVRRLRKVYAVRLMEFQPAHLVGGATFQRVLLACSIIISTRAPRGGCDLGHQGQELLACISTRAPRGGATRNVVNHIATATISTRAPRGGATANLYKISREKLYGLQKIFALKRFDAKERAFLAEGSSFYAK